MNAISALYDINPKILVCYKNDNPIAFMPYYEKRFITLKKAFNPVLVYYSPMLFKLPQRKQENRNMLLKYEITRCMGNFLQKSYQKVSLNLNPEIDDIRGFRDEKLKTNAVYTFIADLASSLDFHKNERTTFRKAINQGYVFHQGFHPEKLLELLFQMYSRKKHPFIENRQGLLKLLYSLHEHCLIEQYNVAKQDVIVSSIIIILGNDRTSYAWMTASEPEEMKKGASLFQFHNLFNTLSTGFDKLDLCGANVEGPSRLKAALGADLKLFFQITK